MHRALQAAVMAVIDVLDAGLHLEPGMLQPRGQGAVLLPEPLALDQQREPVLEPQIPAAGLAALLLERLEHAEQLHPLEFGDGLFMEHRRMLSCFQL